MVKVAGILLIIFSAIGVLSYAATLDRPWLDLLDNPTLTTPWMLGMSAGAYFALMLFGLLMMAFFLAFGIFGVSNAGKAAKAQSIINMGSIMCALTVIYLIATIVVSENILFIGITIVDSIIGLALPVLYTVGGIMNKRSLQA